MKSFLNLDELTATLRNYPVRLGLCVNFDGKIFYGYHADEPFDSACAIKSFILLEYTRQLFDGRLSGKELITYNEENTATGSGIVKFLPFGGQVRAEDAVELMIALSDHVATNLLIDLLGIDAINKTIEHHGFLNTKLKKKFLIPKVTNVGTCSPADYVNFFTALKNNQLICAAACEFMRKIFLKQKYKDILTEKFHLLDVASFFIDVASKSGKADGRIYDYFAQSYIVDGGIIYTTKGSYEIALFTEIDHNSALSLSQVKSFIQDISVNFFSMFLEEKS